MWAKMNRFWRKYFLRREPFTTVCYRFLLPGQSRNSRLHAKVMCAAKPSIPLLLWIPLFIINYVFWIFFHAWIACFRAFRNSANRLVHFAGISKSRQFFDLLHLALFYAVPPRFYYRFELFCFPKKEWLDFVYTHQLPHWHQVMNRNSRSSALLANKIECEQKLLQQRIPSVQTQLYIPAGKDARMSDLFTQQDLFFKPNSANHARGCFTLFYDKKTNVYRSDFFKTSSHEKLYQQIRETIQTEDYLVQPLLRNHADVRKLCDTDDLVTLRIITANDAGDFLPVSAVVEIPLPEKKCWYILKMDCETGCLLEPSDWLQQKMEKQPNSNFSALVDRQWPFWQDVLQVACRAHECVADMPVVGWDVAVTEKGVLLIEGNSNWDVTTAQSQTASPLLRTRLAAVYASHL